ncbi:hypothetical protein ES677_14465 [Bizionia gelidisalsuginis]|uniref:Lipoprotein n=1 Tax=Bizionia gelidisalsuginis TaxID=291188 RepID=A0ABY3M722_9FLAO|nr:hypothetical protein [Bizionia gelidisalsuginis]TYC08431.1 hypothetical protein ES677_14465 [Bizionia gelidisalsuginis]
MKSIIKITTILFFALSLSSCSNDNTEDLNDNQLIDNNQSIDKIMSEITKLGNENEKAVAFQIVLENGKFTKKNVKIVDDIKFINDFENGYNGTSNQLIQDTMQINCETEDGTITTYCDGDDGGCVGGAIRNCLDSGGCATVCGARITYIPKKIKL